MGTVRDFKFDVRIDARPTNQKNAKIVQNGRGRRHATYFYNFCTPYYIYHKVDFGA